MTTYLSTEDRMVTIFSSSDPMEQALAESSLRELGVPFVTQRSAIQHLLGAGQIGGVNLVTGSPEIQVAEKDAERAKELLRDILGPVDSTEQVAELESEPETAEAVERRSRAIRFARYSAVWAVLYLFGIGSVLGIYFGIRSFKTSSDIPTSQKGLAVFGIAVALITLALRALVLISASTPW
jgi:Putative prokaryotic signal transducing protein